MFSQISFFFFIFIYLETDAKQEKWAHTITLKVIFTYPKIRSAFIYIYFISIAFIIFI